MRSIASGRHGESLFSNAFAALSALRLAGVSIGTRRKRPPLVSRQRYD
jgi:hypothetical protein